MADIIVDKGIITELADDYDLDADWLHTSVIEAIKAYRAERDFWTWRDGATSYVAEITPILDVVQKASEMWSSLPPQAREEVSYFLDMDRSSDPIRPKFEFIVGLLEEYREHYARGRGSPGKSRSGTGLSLRPLRAFAEVMIHFWVSSKKAPFGNVVERHVELATKPGERAPRVAKSAGLEFLNATGVFLHPDRYQIENFETVAGKIKKAL